jgi:hypothetical protein
MGVAMTNCPDCHLRLRRSDNGAGMSADLPKGAVVLACQPCRQVTILGSGKWIRMDAEWRKTLKLIAGATAEQKSIEQSVAEATPDDPRWDTYEILEGRI